MSIRISSRWLLILILAAALAGSAAGGLIVLSLGSRPGEAGDTPDGIALADAIELVMPAVVGVTTVSITRDEFYRPVPVRGVGSGIIVDPAGIILTNDHVVGGADEITVLLADGRRTVGRVLWTGPDLDLAVISIDEPDLVAATLGDSDAVRVGETALAIGNPLGLRFQRSVTAGIISALDRAIMLPGGGGMRIMEDLIQTDASINPGNSGGPLLNIHGHVIGVNTAKVPEAEGLGFAIPINLARPILAAIIEQGEFRRPYIGVRIVDSQTAQFLNDEVEVPRGALIVSAVPGGPAQRAGIHDGDTIIAVAGQPVTAIADVRRALLARTIGEVVDVRVIREQTELSFAVRLEEMPAREEEAR